MNVWLLLVSYADHFYVLILFLMFCRFCYAQYNMWWNRINSYLIAGQLMPTVVIAHVQSHAVFGFVNAGHEPEFEALVPESPVAYRMAFFVEK